MCKYRFAVIAPLLLIILAGCATSPAPTESTTAHFSLREQANQLYDSRNFSEALPLYEQLVAEKPDDVFLLERYGFVLVATASNLNDPEQQRVQRLKGRDQLLKAQKLGDDSDLSKIVLESIGDGTAQPFSDNKAVDKVMHGAEAAFSRGDFATARTGYLLALQEDPSLYVAALFMGDTFFAEHKLEKAGEWFQKAIEIDPDQETAHRYWGDTLLEANRMQEAYEQYIEAIIAEPYSARSRSGLSKWMKKQKREFSIPQIVPPVSVESGKDNKPAVVINVDKSKADNGEELGFWLIYATTRSTWREKTFSETYPKETSYRHSLAEEAAAYRTALAFSQLKEKGKPAIEKKDSQIATVARLAQTDLLESYILLFQADKGIAVDYAAYRQQHRDQLRKMLEEVVPIKKGPAKIFDVLTVTLVAHLWHASLSLVGADHLRYPGISMFNKNRV